MKTVFASSFTLAALCAAAVPAFAEAPLYQFDDGTSISALCSVRADFNDNLYLTSSDKTSDVILHLVPGLELSKGGKDAQSSFKFTVKEDLSMYMDEDQNNYQATHVNAAYSYAGARLNGTIAAGFDMNQNTTSRDVRGELIEYYSYYAKALGSYKIGEKVSVSSGFSWNGTTYQNHRDQYNDRESYSIPLSVYHSVLTEKLRAGLSYEYRYTDLAAYKGQNGNPGYQQVHFFGVSAVGDVTEKLTVDGRIGYTTSDYNRRTTYGNDGRENTLGMNAAFNWAATEKTSARLALSRDFEISGNGDDITSTGIALSVNHRMDTHWSFNAGLDYRNDDYNDSSRKDDVYTARVGANYNVNEYLNVAASYSFQWDDSNWSTSEYTKNLVSLSLNFRY
ncbi:MAG: outer membrane beta-barrel protein [Candidatus Spyradosoma sp.]